MKPGTKVRMKKSMAKWYLDHAEVWVRPSTLEIDDPEYDVVMQLSLLCCMGEDIIGTRTHEGDMGCHYVNWQHGNLRYSAYYEPEHYEVVK